MNITKMLARFRLSAMILAGLVMLLLLVPGSAQADAPVMRVHVWWNEDGQQQEWLNVTLGSSITIKRDPGSQVQIRVFQNDDPLSSVDFWCVDFNNSIQKKVTSSQWYVDFLDCVGSGDAQVWAYVENLQGRVEILVYNIVPQEPDLTVSNIRYPCQ